jgi:predicted DNA repair protein MutK
MTAFIVLVSGAIFLAFIVLEPICGALTREKRRRAEKERQAAAAQRQKAEAHWRKTPEGREAEWARLRKAYLPGIR